MIKKAVRKKLVLYRKRAAVLVSSTALLILSPGTAYAEEAEVWIGSADSSSYSDISYVEPPAEEPAAGDETSSSSVPESVIPEEPAPESVPTAEPEAASSSSAVDDAGSGEAAPAEGEQGTDAEAGKETAEDADAEEKAEDEEESEEEEMEQDASEEAIELIPEIRAFYSNEDLLAAQNIVHLTLEGQMDSMFEHVDRERMLAGSDTFVYEQMNMESAKVGRLTEGDTVYILTYQIEGWCYVESGPVRGFMMEADLVHEDAAAEAADAADCTYGEQLVSPIDNYAWTYEMLSVHETLIPKEYVLCETGNVNILEEPDASARAIGEMPSGSLAFLIEDVGDGWYYVESGAVRGFVDSSQVSTGIEVNAAVSASGEQAYVRAKQLVSPDENRARYYSVASVYENGGLNPVRREICEEAANYLGNPYVWGGTSLTDGADCSGFVQSLFAMFGYELPRVAESQSMVGIQIPVEDALPGDLIFFAQEGYVYHVALCIGDGMDIEAYGTSVGIIVNDIDMGNAVWATRIIED